MLTSGYELCTAITNLVIFIISLIIYFNIKNIKRWNIFYLFIVIDSFLGIIVHGINMSNSINNILWIILLILFSITFNLLLYLFCNISIKKVFIISFILFIGLLILLIFKLNFVITLITYALIIVLICLYSLFRSNNRYKYYYIIGMLLQIVGVIPVYFKLKIGYYNHNCLCHTFTLLAIILFYFGIKKESLK